MDRLAKNGLRYNQFHTTALCSPTRAALLTNTDQLPEVTMALCSPTRAALLSGRNHHSANTGVIMELGSGFPGSNFLMSKSCGTFVATKDESATKSNGTACILNTTRAKFTPVNGRIFF